MSRKAVSEPAKNEPSKPRIGFVGLGVMGLPMATNLLRAGYSVTCHTRTASRAKSLLAAGARHVESAAEVARAADIVITMLPDAPDVEAVAKGEAGLFTGSPGLVWIDMSSISPTVSRRLAKDAEACGILAIDAPVSGGEQAAIAGTLVIMVGGDESVLQKCRPVLEVLGSSIVHVGASGAGQVAKACNQMIVAVSIGCVAEALCLGAKAGIDPARIREVLLGGFAHSRVLDVHGARMLDGRHDPGFRTELHVKDISIATEAARQYGAAVPLTACVAQLMNALVANGGGSLDHSALVKVYELAGSQRLVAT